MSVVSERLAWNPNKLMIEQSLRSGLEGKELKEKGAIDIITVTPSKQDQMLQTQQQPPEPSLLYPKLVYFE